jgi:3-oxoacyl-[acyl-carrier protein] reductase
VSVPGDLTDEGEVSAIAEAVADAGITELAGLVVSVTGFGGQPTGAADLPLTDLRRLLETDLVGPFAVVQALLGPLRAGRGRVVLFGSLAGLRGRPGAAHLCAAKAGIVGLAKGLSRELAPQGIRVNVVAPGPVVAEGEHHPGLPPGMPVSRPEQVAEAALLLLSSANRSVDGQVLVLEGSPSGPPGPPHGGDQHGG